MIIGIPREIKPEERRVSLTPEGVEACVCSGHQVVVEQGAGRGAGISDAAYRTAGARVTRHAVQLWRTADMVIKVKEPLPPEFPFLRDGQIIFTFLHLAANRSLTLALIKKRAVGIAYETVQLSDGSLPILKPMSEVAGYLSAELGARGLEAVNGGSGILMGGFQSLPPARVTVVGGGNAGLKAALTASAMGAAVTILDRDRSRIKELRSLPGRGFLIKHTTPAVLASVVIHSDVVIGSVLNPGAKAPRLITREMVRRMKKGSVIVDIAIDQGGCCETIRPTTHGNPFYLLYGIVHCGITNLPSVVPFTSTTALCQSSLPFVLEIADRGYREASSCNPAIRRGINVAEGMLTNRAVASSFGFPCQRV